jgi:hypothetical protein
MLSRGPCGEPCPCSGCSRSPQPACSSDLTVPYVPDAGGGSDGPDAGAPDEAAEAASEVGEAGDAEQTSDAAVIAPEDYASFSLMFSRLYCRGVGGTSAVFPDQRKSDSSLCVNFRSGYPSPPDRLGHGGSSVLGLQRGGDAQLTFGFGPRTGRRNRSIQRAPVGGGAFAGRSSVKMQPFPGRSRTFNVPLCARAACCAIGSPKPKVVSVSPWPL